MSYDTVFSGSLNEVHAPVFADELSSRVQGILRAAGTVAINAVVYGVEADTVALFDASSTASATSIISSASANFLPTDVGKLCAILSYADSANTCKYGTITQYISQNQVVASLNGSPGALTGAQFVYGSDNRSALQSALNAADASNGTVFLPAGIIGLSNGVVIPDGVSMIGQGRTITGNFAKNFRYCGTSIVALASCAANYVVKVCDGSSSAVYGALLADCNIDGMLLAKTTVQSGGNVATLDRCTVIRNSLPSGYVVNMGDNGGGGKLLNCICIGQQVGHVVQAAGDAKLINNQIFGSGNGYYGIKVSNHDDVLIAHNHIWKDAASPTCLGGSVLVEGWGNDSTKGGITIQGNKFDTAFGPHIFINVYPTGANIRGISVLNNISMNNDNVPANTYPWLQITIPAGYSVRGLIVANNLVRASWWNSTKGTHTAFIDGSGIAGNVYGSIVKGNFIDNLATAAPYNAFAPTVGVNQNLYLQGTGTVPTAF